MTGHGEGSRTFWDRVSFGRAGKFAPGWVPGHSEAMGRGAQAGREVQEKKEEEEITLLTLPVLVNGMLLYLALLPSAAGLYRGLSHQPNSHM